jgi:hypothetical protein
MSVIVIMNNKKDNGPDEKGVVFGDS